MPVSPSPDKECLYPNVSDQSGSVGEGADEEELRRASGAPESLRPGGQAETGRVRERAMPTASHSSADQPTTKRVRVDCDTEVEIVEHAVLDGEEDEVGPEHGRLGEQETLKRLDPGFKKMNLG